MESFDNFKSGFSQAYNELRESGELPAEHEAVVCGVVSGGLRNWFKARRAHRAVRKLYAKEHGVGFFQKIDWTKVVEWIKANWLSIIRLIITVAPILI